MMPTEKPRRRLVSWRQYLMTLARSSDRPLTTPQDELLRAARQGQETPPEQLLRATAEDGHHA